MATITVTVPDDLASDLRDADLLAPEAVEDMAAILRDGLRRYMIGNVIRTADRSLVSKGPPPTLEEIQEEVKAVRAEMLSSMSRPPARRRNYSS